MPEKKRYIDVNVPREWEQYLTEALKKPEIQKQLKMNHFTKSYSGLGSWIIREFLIAHTGFHFQHFKTYENPIPRATIVDNKIRRLITLYPKEKESGVELWCEHCDSTDCEHVKFALTVPSIKNLLKKDDQ